MDKSSDGKHVWEAGPGWVLTETWVYPCLVQDGLGTGSEGEVQENAGRMQGYGGGFTVPHGL